MLKFPKTSTTKKPIKVTKEIKKEVKIVKEVKNPTIFKVYKDDELIETYSKERNAAAENMAKKLALKINGIVVYA